MKLSSLLSPELVFVGIKGNDRKTIYSDILNRLCENLSLKLDNNQIVKMMIDREELTRMPYECGLAIPHARSPKFLDLHFALAILDEPVMLKSYDAAPSRIILMSLISENTSDLYLKVLSTFAKYISVQGNPEKIVGISSPEAIMEIFRKENIEIKHTLTAEDVMDKCTFCLTAEDEMSTAIDIFTKEHTDSLPVVDNNGKLIGVFNTDTVLKRAIPDYLFMMDNINFLTSFEPFEKVLKDEGVVKVGEIMKKDFDVIPPSMPLVQITVRLLKNRASRYYVVGNGVLKGVVRTQNIIEKILRG